MISILFGTAVAAFVAFFLWRIEEWYWFAVFGMLALAGVAFLLGI